MRVSRFFVKPLAVLALFAATAAVAAELATVDLTVVNSTPTSAMLCVVPSPAAVGQPCTLTANGMPVASFVLQPGGNYRVVPSFGPATIYAATGPGIEGKSILEEGLGLN